MSRIRTYLLIVIASVLAGLIGAAFGSGTAQAVVSTLVSVVNPGTSPVPTTVTNPNTSPVLNSSVDDPGRIPYESQLVTSSCGGSGNCTLTFPTVPAGHRVVVQHITGFDTFFGNNTPTFFYLIASVDNLSAVSSFFPPFQGILGYAFDQPVLFYVDSGHTVAVIMSTDQVFNGAGFMTLKGYELDCTVANCKAIATE